MNGLGEQDYKIKLEVFEGPLDLLLYLIKKNEVDVYDIPVALISAQYIEYLELMKALNLDIAGEFLLMAATLAHIKSQMLVPTPLPGDEDALLNGDPRADLVKQLLEYQKYKDAANELLNRELLNRDVFKREKTPMLDERPKETTRELVEISIFNLIDSFSKLLKQIPEDFPHEFYIEKLTIRERIAEIADLLNTKPNRSIKFTDLFADLKNRSSVIITFLATLEMIKMSLIRATQSLHFGEIIVSATDNLTNNWDFENAPKEPDKISN
jgi:segregation and condensation protein A